MSESLTIQSNTAPHRSVHVVTLAPGVTGIIQTGRVLADTPIALEDLEEVLGPDGVEMDAGAPPAGYEVTETETADEQTWFRNTFGNGAQACVQGWDWAFANSSRPVVTGTGVAMVGREGTSNGTFRMFWWNNGAWVEFWSAVVVPGHWVSQGVTGQNKYIRFSLSGAGSNTQVSLAARY